MADGHHILSDSVEDALDRGTRFSKHSGDHHVWCLLSSQNRTTGVSAEAPHSSTLD